MHPARDYEVSNPAKYLRSVAERNARNAPATNNGPTPTSTLVWDAKRTDDPVESGEEIVEVQGQRIATHRESAKYTAPDFNNESGVTLVVTVWTSDAVPTGWEVQREKEALALRPIRRHGRNSGVRGRACG